MLTRLRDVSGGSEVLPFVPMFYGTPSKYVWEDDDGETVTLWSSDVIQKGIQLLPDDRKIVIMNGGDWDADDADHIMQLGTFGEVVYG